MALCLSEDRDQLIEATREAELAIHLEPDQPYPQFVLAVILDKRNQRADAEEAIVQAIAIDPTDADFYGFHSYLQSRKKNNWQATLDTAIAAWPMILSTTNAARFDRLLWNAWAALTMPLPMRIVRYKTTPTQPTLMPARAGGYCKKATTAKLRNRFVKPCDYSRPTSLLVRGWCNR